MSESTASGERGRSSPPPLAAAHDDAGDVEPLLPAVHGARPPRAGELSLGWRVAMAFGWIGVTMALAAVWNASVQLGLSTWWLGPRSDPRPLPVRLAPFVAPVLMVLGTINNVRWLGWYGLAAAGTVGAVGVADLGSVGSLAAIELVIAGAGASISLASLAGTYRAGPRSTPTPGPSRTGRDTSPG